MGNGSSTVRASALALMEVHLNRPDECVFIYAQKEPTLREIDIENFRSIRHPDEAQDGEEENPPNRELTEMERVVCPPDPEGGTVALLLWPGALSLARYLAGGFVDFSGKKILEIGCGVGLPGLTVAKFFNPARVVLSDRPSVREVVEHSIRANNLTASQCVYEPFDWGSSADLKMMKSQFFDFVIGSELVYAEEQEPLINALLAVTTANPAATIILAYTTRTEADETYFREKIFRFFELTDRVGNNYFFHRRSIPNHP